MLNVVDCSSEVQQSTCPVLVFYSRKWTGLYLLSLKGFYASAMMW